uniref:Uncharacterized protein n=1 Tax=Anguilla anguilla TaxID=7936 RepID=A0A0E9VEH3_ANGAN
MYSANFYTDHPWSTLMIRLGLVHIAHLPGGKTYAQKPSYSHRNFHWKSFSTFLQIGQPSCPLN